MASYQSQRFQRINLKKKKNYSDSTQEDVTEINWAIKKTAQAQHRFKAKYRINHTLREEQSFIRRCLDLANGIIWATPIAHIVERDAKYTSAGDSCLYGGGGFSVAFRFWWHLTWPESIKKRTLLFMKNNRMGRFISINVLEFVTIVINYCAALTALQEDGCEDPYPVILIWADNTNSVRWTNHGCRESLIGRALARFFVFYL